MLDDLLLAIHVTAGAAALVLGPAAIWRRLTRRSHDRAEALYHAGVMVVCLSAAGLVALSWRELWWLSILAALTYALALLGYVAPRRRFRGWPRAYAHGQGGSLVALVTALLVVSVSGSILVWLAPTIVGLPLIERLQKEIAGSQ